MSKKIAIFFVSCVCLLLIYSSYSYALGYGNATGRIDIPECMLDEELLSSEVTKDDKGHFQSGYFYREKTTDNFNELRMNVYNVNGGYLYVTREDITPEETTEGIKLFQFRMWCTSKYEEMPISGTERSETDVFSDVHVVYERDAPSLGWVLIGNMYFIVDKNFDNKDYDEQISSFCTNLPVFDIEDTESINAYINSGDYSGAENADNINGQVGETDSSIEKPKNLKVTSNGKYTNMIGSAVNAPFIGDYIAHWEQTVDTIDYEYDCEVRFVFKNIIYNNIPGLQIAVKQTYTSDWYTMRQGFPYLGEKNMELKIDRNVLNNAVVYNFVSLFKTGTVLDSVMAKGSLVSYDIEKVQIRIRNRNGDKVSNYVTTTVDYKTNSITASVTDKDDNKVEDEEYNDTDVDETTGDKDILDAITDDDSGFGISSIMAFIKSGFGLLGDYGIIALMSRTYSYLPRSIWTIITFFISMLVVICIVKAIKEVLL